MGGGNQVRASGVMGRLKLEVGQGRRSHAKKKKVGVRVVEYKKSSLAADVLL